MRLDVPTGTVTFLFTDIEGSTELVRRLGDEYPTLLAEHNRLLAASFGAHGGHEIDRQGDALFVAFPRARDAVTAAVEAQRALARTAWPHGVHVRTRIGIHTGEPGLAETGYHGLDVVRGARIGAAAHGGQVLVSALTAGLLADEAPSGVTFGDLGEHRLKDLDRPERIYQVLADGLEADFPPLRDVEPALPVAGRERELAEAAQAAMSAMSSPDARTRAVAHPFVGRARELAELQEALDQAGAGRGCLVLVTGDPGIGKTRLIQELELRASEHGWRVLVGRCWEEGGAPAYWPWIQIVRSAGGDFERLAAPHVDGSARGGVDPESLRFQLFDAAARFLEEAARRRPLVIVLEDLHAADAASLLLLRFVGQAIAQSPILVLGTYRERESSVHQQSRLFAELVRVARRISLRGLSVEEVHLYIQSLADRAAPASAPKLHQATGGNPFFLGEVVKLLLADGLLEHADADVGDPMLRVPEEVRTLIRRRVAGLSPEAVSELRVAAVIGRDFDARILQHVSPLDEARLLDVLTEAFDAGALVHGAVQGRYAFIHELFRETLYEDLPPSRRLALHLEIGNVIEELAGRDLDPHLSEIAHHLASATPLGDADRAVDYLQQAGDRAAALSAYEEAALHFERALQLLGATEDASAERRGELLLRSGDAHWRAGTTKDARARFEEATDVARRLGDGELLARAALGYVNALGGFFLSARFEVGATGAGLLEEALAALPEGDSPFRARLLARLTGELYSAHEPLERRVAVSEEAIGMARRLADSEALVAALYSRNWALAVPELVRERLEHTEEMLRVARELGGSEMEFVAHNARYHCFLELCDGRGMALETDAMGAIAERVRQPVYLWHTVCLRAARATLDGRFAEAERLAGEALEIGGLRHSVYSQYVFRFAQLYAIRWAQGRLHELEAQVADHSERFQWVPRWRDALLAAELGDERAARAEVERQAGRGFAGLPRDGLWILHLCGLAEACVLIGDTPRAERLYELLLPHAELNAVSYTQQPFGPVALRLGMLSRLLERWEDAQCHFETALRQCELLGARAIRARSQYEHARTLLARGTQGDADRGAELLEEAERLCDELELTTLRERIEAAKHAPTTRPGAVFLREGEFWTIRYDAGTFRLRDVKGLRYIAMLLGQPGRETHVLELVHAAEGLPPDAQAAVDVTDLSISRGDEAPVLDAQAKEAYGRRLQELGAELEQARDWNDPERVARLEEEIDALTDELARATGLGGRDRGLPSPAERARVSVTKAIRAAIRGIDRHDAALGAHLTASIRTGRFCSYAPPGEVPPDWRL
jgi:class 3 adenylate cyclase/tetratricopeptide (TPR) repeat protein